MEEKERGPRRYPPLHPKPPGPDPWSAAAFVWLMPLLNRWGIAGVIICLGLIYRLIEAYATYPLSR